MACTAPCSCCKGACCFDDGFGGYTCSQETCTDCEGAGGKWQGPGTTCPSGTECPCDPPANHAYCEKCVDGDIVNKCTPPQFCDGGACADPTSADCYQTCEAKNDGNSRTTEIPPSPYGGLWEWVDAPYTRRVFMQPYKNEGYASLNGVTSLYSTIIDGDGNQRTYEWSYEVIYNDYGCPDHVVTSGGVEASIWVNGAFWEACYDSGAGAGCSALTPPTPVITWDCSDTPCDGGTPCVEGNCCDPGTCQPGDCNPFP